MSKQKIEEQIKILDKEHFKMVNDMNFFWKEAKVNEVKIISSKNKIKKLHHSRKILSKVLLGISALCFAFAIFTYPPLVLISAGIICSAMLSNVLHDYCINKNEQNIKNNEELLKINKSKQEELFNQITEIREKRFFLKDQLMSLNSKNRENNNNLTGSSLKKHTPNIEKFKE